MQFARPPRHISNAPSISKSFHPISNPKHTSRRRLRLFSIIFTILLLVGLFAWRMIALSSPKAKLDDEGHTVLDPLTSKITIVTVIDSELMESGYVARLKHNRDDWAKRQGYQTIWVDNKDYKKALKGAPASWAVIPAVRHAMAEHPETEWFFSLSPHAVIMNPDIDLRKHVLDPDRLEDLMLRDHPVVPPSSVIHTFKHLRGDKIDLVLTQDGEGLCPESFLIRRGEWAKFFLDTWFDPLYRSYNFQKGEAHALEHIVQWHPTILARLAIVPLRTINAYSVEIASRGGGQMTYRQEDLLVRAVNCEKDPSRVCEHELDPWWHRWHNYWVPGEWMQEGEGVNKPNGK